MIASCHAGGVQSSTSTCMRRRGASQNPSDSDRSFVGLRKLERESPQPVARRGAGPSALQQGRRCCEREQSDHPTTACAIASRARRVPASPTSRPEWEARAELPWLHGAPVPVATTTTRTRPAPSQGAGAPGKLHGRVQRAPLQLDRLHWRRRRSARDAAS
jgi:hypothetical protein